MVTQPYTKPYAYITLAVIGVALLSSTSSMNTSFATVAMGPSAWGFAVSDSTKTSFSASLDGAQEVPPAATTAAGTGSFEYNSDSHVLTYNIEFSGLSSAESGAHFHGPAVPGDEAGILFTLPAGSPKVGSVDLDDLADPASAESDLLSGLWYVNIHSSTYPGGEIRGQVTATGSMALLSAPGIDIDCVGLTNSVGAVSATCRLFGPEGSGCEFGAVPHEPECVSVVDYSATSPPTYPSVPAGCAPTCKEFDFTIPGSYITMPGEWKLVIGFFDSNGKLIDLCMADVRVASFFVVPESAFGVAALVGSSLAALGGFAYFRRPKKDNR